VQAVALKLLLHPFAAPVHEDHAHLAARHVSLVVLAEQGVAVPEQPPLSDHVQPGRAVHESDDAALRQGLT
jgi:hypothetical protein